MILKPKKSLGQNFLKSEVALHTMVKAGEVKPTDTVLEIGPGKGILTERLLEVAALVIAVEKDRELFSYLQEKFAIYLNQGKLILIEGDILNLKIEDLKLSTYKIIANIPYNITGAILKKFLTEKFPPKEMVLMVQKEVAKRIVAQDKKESILSISVKAYGQPKFIMKVEARYFSPAPKVDSAIIAIKSISRETFEQNRVSEELFWEIVKAGFSHKRKKLLTNLKNLSFFPKIEEKIQVGNLGSKRAEDLSLKDWIDLARI